HLINVDKVFSTHNRAMDANSLLKQGIILSEQGILAQEQGISPAKPISSPREVFVHIGEMQR
ncbi:MAG: hypothetical protein WCD83_01405, partial [Pseudolabrys sp.]